MKPLNKSLSSIYEIIDSVVVSAVVVLLLFTFVFRIFVVSGPSMNDTLKNGERIVVSDIFYTPKNGDIICFYSESEDEVLVKRVIATEGQTVNIDMAGGVYVNGVKLDEQYIGSQFTMPQNVTMPHTVEKDHVFVLGDNRGVSLDSRYSRIGDVHVHDIFGKMLFRLYPFGKVK